ncbi:M15 family metallopeptidase [Sulfurimonas diazotrophicus]|uniref:D-alanyl-D-alanine dipeptidase n=1 Tax=Sulfurimonas diazotrophicus TaxID=3131939 RepID=A0ABZ3HBX7_9BACT
MRSLLFSLLLFCLGAAAEAVPPDFVDLKAAVPSLRIEARYFGSNNFVGRPVDGYEAPRCYLTRPAAAALKQAEAALAPFGLGLKVFDAYRPQRAVDHFVRWAKDLDDTKMKAAYYPRVDKSVLFKAGYIAARSGHSRGSTVDLTLVDRESGQELDMGTGFDFFGPESWPDSMAVTAQQRANRLLLQRIMTRAGFRPLREEWWHFTLESEPYPDRYFDFPVR